MIEEQRTVDTPLGPMTYLLTVKKVKNMNLRVRSDGTVTVSISRRVPKTAADDFVRSRASWLRGRMDGLERHAVPITPPDKGEALILLRRSLEQMWPLVKPLGIKRPELRARFMTSRWGSCHYNKGIIVMNTALAVVPEGLRDYVTLHELVHFLHPNHGKGFYSTMDALMPDWKKRRSMLKSFYLQKGVLGEPDGEQ